MTDTALKVAGMNILVKDLGVVQAEKFVSLILKEPFDYTKWRDNLFEDMTVEDLDNAEMQSWNDKY